MWTLWCPTTARPVQSPNQFVQCNISCKESNERFDWNWALGHTIVVGKGIAFNECPTTQHCLFRRPDYRSGCWLYVATIYQSQVKFNLQCIPGQIVFVGSFTEHHDVDTSVCDEILYIIVSFNKSTEFIYIAKFSRNIVHASASAWGSNATFTTSAEFYFCIYSIWRNALHCPLY